MKRSGGQSVSNEDQNKRSKSFALRNLSALVTAVSDTGVNRSSDGSTFSIPLERAPLHIPTHATNVTAALIKATIPNTFSERNTPLTYTAEEPLTIEYSEPTIQQTWAESEYATTKQLETTWEAAARTAYNQFLSEGGLMFSLESASNYDANLGYVNKWYARTGTVVDTETYFQFTTSSTTAQPVLSDSNTLINLGYSNNSTHGTLICEGLSFSSGGSLAISFLASSEADNTIIALSADTVPNLFESTYLLSDTFADLSRIHILDSASNGIAVIGWNGANDTNRNLTTLVITWDDTGGGQMFVNGMLAGRFANRTELNSITTVYIGHPSQTASTRVSVSKIYVSDQNLSLAEVRILSQYLCSIPSDMTSATDSPHQKHIFPVFSLGDMCAHSLENTGYKDDTIRKHRQPASRDIPLTRNHYGSQYGWGDRYCSLTQTLDATISDEDANQYSSITTFMYGKHSTDIDTTNFEVYDVPLIYKNGIHQLRSDNCVFNPDSPNSIVSDIIGYMNKFEFNEIEFLDSVVHTPTVLLSFSQNELSSHMDEGNSEGLSIVAAEYVTGIKNLIDTIYAGLTNKNVIFVIATPLNILTDSDNNLLDPYNVYTRAKYINEELVQTYPWLRTTSIDIDSNTDTPRVYVSSVFGSMTETEFAALTPNKYAYDSLTSTKVGIDFRNYFNDVKTFSAALNPVYIGDTPELSGGILRLSVKGSDKFVRLVPPNRTAGTTYTDIQTLLDNMVIDINDTLNVYLATTNDFILSATYDSINNIVDFVYNDNPADPNCFDYTFTLILDLSGYLRSLSTSAVISADVTYPYLLRHYSPLAATPTQQLPLNPPVDWDISPSISYTVTIPSGFYDVSRVNTHLLTALSRAYDLTFDSDQLNITYDTLGYATLTAGLTSPSGSTSTGVRINLSNAPTFATLIGFDGVSSISLSETVTSYGGTVQAPVWVYSDEGSTDRSYLYQIMSSWDHDADPIFIDTNFTQGGVNPSGGTSTLLAMIPHNTTIGQLIISEPTTLTRVPCNQLMKGANPQQLQFKLVDKYGLPINIGTDYAWSLQVLIEWEQEIDIDRLRLSISETQYF